MALPRTPLVLAAVVLALAVASAGCFSVYSLKSALSTDVSSAALKFQNVLAYENNQNPADLSCNSYTDSRGVYVPPRAEWVSVYVFAKISSVPPQLQDFDPRHFDFTLKDGAGTTWVDIHLRNSDTLKDIRIDGPLPGAWTITLSAEICDGNILVFQVDDQFSIQIVVRQPV